MVVLACLSSLLGGVGRTCDLPSVVGSWLYLLVDFGLMFGFGFYFLRCGGGCLYGGRVLMFVRVCEFVFVFWGFFFLKCVFYFCFVIVLICCVSSKLCLC